MIRKSHLDVHPDLALRYALKRINEAVAPEGLVAPLLIFGDILSHPISNKTFP